MPESCGRASMYAADFCHPSAQAGTSRLAVYGYPVHPAGELGRYSQTLLVKYCGAFSPLPYCPKSYRAPANLSKYRYMELSLQQRRKALSTKIPDIQQTLSVVKYLQLRRKKAAGETIEEEKDDEDDLDSDLEEEEEEGKEEKLKTLFELNDTLYAEAEVEETGEVGLWLGVSFV